MCARPGERYARDALERLGQSKVDYLRRAKRIFTGMSGGDQDVAGLQVAMDNPLLMGEMDADGELADKVCRLTRRDRHVGGKQAIE
jgi:hypothetical protein